MLALLISDAALNEDARACHAVLASKGRNTDGQYWECGGERRVVEHDHRSLAAELQVHPLQRRGTSCGDLPADLNTAGEADRVDIGGLDEERRAGVARLGEHVDNAGRQ